MFGIRFAKFDPTTYVIKYAKGKISAQGTGLAFYYYAPAASITVIPVGSADAPFMFSETSADFQELTLQGQLTYRIADPVKTAGMLNYTIDNYRRNYVSEDPQKLSDRLVNLALIAAKGAVKRLSLKEALVASDDVARRVFAALREDPMVQSLGVEILSLSIAAIKPTPETATALEAEAREEILKESDEAIFKRRNYAVEQERIIRESELNTEIAVEQKNREIQETRMASERLMQQRQQEMEQERMAFQIQQEERNRELVDLRTRNEKIEADTRAYALKAVMQVYEGLSPETLKSLANAGLDSGRLMALAFQGIADRAEKIGNLNITPDLLNTIIRGQDSFQE
jgi:hypothetical protein